MIILDEQPTKAVYVDVNDTLISWPSGKTGEGEPILNQKIASYIKKSFEDGRLVYVWSYKGAKYAQSVVDYFKLGEYVEGCLLKPDEVFEDNKDFPEKKVTFIYSENFEEDKTK